MGILSKTFAAIISSGSIYALYFQYWYNYNRRILLGNQQSMLYASTDIHVITCLTPKDGYDLKIILINLNQKMRQNHGKAIYCGKILRGDNSKQPGMSQEMQDSFQVVLVSQWPSRESFVAFRDQHLRGPICEFKYAWSTPFKRDQWANLSLPMFLGSLYVGNIVNGRTYPVDENNASDETFINSMEKKKVKNFEQLNDMTTLLIGNTMEEQQEPVFIWNWILPGNNKQRQASNEYRDNMMRMLAENGGGVMDVGDTIDNFIGEDYAHFETVAAVHYPSRKFISNMIKSKWMMKTVVGKQLGDTMNRFTVPFFGKGNVIPLNHSSRM